MLHEVHNVLGPSKIELELKFACSQGDVEKGLHTEDSAHCAPQNGTKDMKV